MSRIIFFFPTSEAILESEAASGEEKETSCRRATRKHKQGHRFLIPQAGQV